LFKNTLFSLQIGGIELDLGKLIKVIKDMGGMENVVEKKKWHKVADIMGIPKYVSILH
jgi:protein Jumonji